MIMISLHPPVERWQRPPYLCCLLLLNFFPLFLSFLSANAHVNTDNHNAVLHAPVSGRVLSASAVRSQVRHLHPDGLRPHVFELTQNDQVLVSSHHRLDLSVLLTHSRRVTPPQNTAYSINGRQVRWADLADHDPKMAVAVIKSDTDNTIEAVYHGNELIHVWGRHLDIALMRDGPDGVFIASHMTSTGGESPYPMDDNTILDALKNETDSSYIKPGSGNGDNEDEQGQDTRPSLTPLPSGNSTAGLNSCARGVPHYLEIAVAFDNSLCRFYKNNLRRTLVMIHVLFAAASRPYILDTCVRLALVYVDGHCRDENDPYKPLTQQASVFLALGFNRIWQQEPRASIPRDVVYFISGFNDGTTVLGFGFPGNLGGVCNSVRSFGWIEGIVPGVFAHELGHTLSAKHTDSGLMKAFYEPGPQPRFSQTSISQIVNFVDNRTLAFCLEAEKPKNPLFVVTVLPPPVILPEYGTCAVSRRMGQVLGCTLPRIIGFLRSRKAGTLVIRSWQSFGQFRVDIRPALYGDRMDSNHGKNMVITHFRGLQHLNGTFTKEQLPFLTGKISEQNVSLSRDDVRIRWPRPKLTCCDQRLYIFIHIRWCKKSTASSRSLSGVRRRVNKDSIFDFRSRWRLPQIEREEEVKENENCSVMFQRLSRMIPCRSPCYGLSNGKVLPMSKQRQCPGCLLRRRPYYRPH